MQMSSIASRACLAPLYSRLSVVFGSVSSSSACAGLPCVLPLLSPVESASYLLSSCMLEAGKPASGVGGASCDDAEVA